jgi:hypothetical protein
LLSKTLLARTSLTENALYGTLQEPRPIVHMNQKQKDVFIKKMKKAGPALMKKLIKFLNRQREDICRALAAAGMG